MKWFKHYTNAHKGGVLQDLYCEFGINAGHGLYFRLIEFLADKWDGKSEPKFRFYTEILRNFLGFSPKKFKNFAEILKTSEEISFEIKGKFCEISFPKLLEIRHKDAFPSGQRQDLGGPDGGPITPPILRIKNKSNTTSSSKKKKPSFVQPKSHLELIALLSTELKKSWGEKYDSGWLTDQVEACFSYFSIEHPKKSPQTNHGWQRAVTGWIRRSKTKVFIGEANVPINSTISGVSNEF